MRHRFILLIANFHFQSADKAESSKPEAIEKPIAEAAYNSSKDDDDNTGQVQLENSEKNSFYFSIVTP